jgi:hypothetical protein
LFKVKEADTMNKKTLITQTEYLSYYYGLACGVCLGISLGAFWFVLWLKFGVIHI